MAKCLRLFGVPHIPKWLTKYSAVKGPWAVGFSSDPENVRCGYEERLSHKSAPIHVLSVSRAPKLDLFLIGNERLANRVGSCGGLESEGISSNRA